MANMKRRHATLYDAKLNRSTMKVLAVLGSGSLIYGYTASIIGTTLGQPSFIKYFDLDTRPDATNLISLTNGLFQAGGVIGPLLLPTVSDRFGRKRACAVSALLALISGAGMTASVHIGMFIAFRFFAGASAFMILAAIPIFMAEIVPVHVRGALVDVHAVMFVVGYVIQSWVGFGFYFWKSGSLNTWRAPVAIQCVWPICLLIGLRFIPESPRWLVMRGRDVEARNILVNLHADPADPNHDIALAEFYQIQKQIAIDRTLGNSWWDIITKPHYRKRALFGMGVGVIIQCSGVLVINNYGQTIYRALGFSTVKQLLYPGAWLTFALGLNIIAMFFVDRFPRNKYIAIGVAGCTVALCVEAALVARFIPSNNQAALQAAVAMLFVYQLFYGLCLDGTQFAYMGEIFPNHLRAKGVCLAVAAISLMNVMWLQAAPTAFARIGWRFYLCFIITGAIGATVMWIWFPDTNGVPLEEIAAIFGDVDDVAIYQRDIEIDIVHHTIVDHNQSAGKVLDSTHVENREMTGNHDQIEQDLRVSSD